MIEIKVMDNGETTISYEGKLQDLATHMSTAVRSTLQMVHDKEGAEVCVDVMQHFMLYVMSGKAFGIHQKSMNKLTRVTKQRLKEIEKAKDEVM